MRQALPDASERRIPGMLEVPPWSLRLGPLSERLRRSLDAILVARVKALFRRHPTCGRRKFWLLPRCLVNMQTIYSIVQATRRLAYHCTVASRSRVQGTCSGAAAAGTTWALNLAHFSCGADGCGHLRAVIDCHGGESLGRGCAERGLARELETALHKACLDRFGTLN